MVLDVIKKNGAHYTPSDLSLFIANELKKAFLDSDNIDCRRTLKILDPACGEGNLLLAVQKVFKDTSYYGYGIDIDQTALNTAKKRLNNNFFDFYKLDYADLFAKDKHSSKEETLLEKIQDTDLIIANPPYIRTSILGAEKAQRLSSTYHLKGKIDMYQVFFKAMTQVLRKNGIMCVITSNKYLTNKTGKNIRKFLNENYEILKIIDLGDTKPFSAAVLPAIFIGRKKENADNSSVSFTRVYETSKKVKQMPTIQYISDLLVQSDGEYMYNNHLFEATNGFLDASNKTNDLWNMATVEEKRWADALEAKADKKFDDVFNVHVGIKTTADNVFIKDNWDDLASDTKPEHEVLHKLISSKRITRWSTDNNNLKEILYTHTVENGKRVPIDFEKYPHALKYLNLHKEQLASRKYIKKAKRNWFEIWVPQQPKQLSSNKVVFPDISNKAKFCYDDTGVYVDGNCYWLTTKGDTINDYLLLACGVANSATMEKYYDIKFQNVLYSGRRRYLTQYVKNYLLPDINNEHSQKVINLVKEIIGQHITDKNLEKRINDEVRLAFNIDI